MNSIAPAPDCTHAYIGGSFTNVDGVTASNIAYIRTYNNTLVNIWVHGANGPVDTLLLTPNGHLLADGEFTSINGSSDNDAGIDTCGGASGLAGICFLPYPS